MDGPEIDREIDQIRSRLTRLDAEREKLAARLAALERGQRQAVTTPPLQDGATVAPAAITAASSPADKIKLFRRLFAGRSDVFPVRWDNTRTNKSGYAPACANEWAKGTCGKPTVKCGECPNQAFIPVSEVVLARHLTPPKAASSDAGRGFVMGVYALLQDETCWFLAVDFDGTAWSDDARAFMETCRLENVPAALERSRSGQGGHVIARDARRLGAWLVTRTMERRPEIGFKSYDRFFPSQDTMPHGGFGNLIALPLQWQARARGNSLFVDDALQPYDDQWSYLASVPLMDPKAMPAAMLVAEAGGGVFGGVRLPVEDENADRPWLMTPSRRRDEAAVSGPLPASVQVVLADQVYVDRTALPAAMTARLVRLAAFQNPEFYRAQAMRMPTFDKQRIVSCAELSPRHVGLPRGCLDEALALLRSHNIAVEFEDHRHAGSLLPVGMQFVGELSSVQKTALEALAAHDFGVLAATTAFGKTVVAAALIAKRQCNTLVLVHRRELLDQWVERLRSFLSIEPELMHDRWRPPQTHRGHRRGTDPEPGAQG